jgi:microcystin-dependent protein
MWRGDYDTPFVTPLDNPPGTISRRILIPGNEQFAQLVSGVLAQLIQPENFTETPGGLSVEETVQKFQEMFTSYLEPEAAVMALPIGTIVPHMRGSNLPSNWLPCDGSQYEIGLYPDLYAVLPAALKTPEYFVTPDLRERVPVGANDLNQAYNQDLGEMAGQAEVALTIQQIPVHSHTTPSHTHSTPAASVPGGFGTFPVRANLANWTGGAGAIPLHANTNPLNNQDVSLPSVDIPAMVTSAAAPTTNAAGSGWVHTNLQPFTVVNYAIVALEG